MPSLIFRKGLGLKHAVADALAADYHSELVDRIRDSTYQYRSGRVTVYLARACGFCYGVDRAGDYAYQTRRRFPNRPVYLTGEIIHNAHVNESQRNLAVTTHEHLSAQINVDVAPGAVDESMQQARNALESAASGDFHAWHRNWIVSRKQELAVRREALAKSRAAVQLARQRAQDARHSVRSLERWFERVWRRHQKAQQQVEQRALDETGALRCAPPRARELVGVSAKRRQRDRRRSNRYDVPDRPE